MNATQYVVPAVLRGAMLVPRQAPGRREPARVTPGAFKAAAAMIGLVREDGQRAVAATIRSGFERMGVAYEPPH